MHPKSTCVSFHPFIELIELSNSIDDLNNLKLKICFAQKVHVQQDPGFLN